MKPNDKAIEAARAAILKAMAERNCIIAGVPFNENNTDEFDAGEAAEHAKVALDAAYAAQFQSEEYAGLIKELRACEGSIFDEAADALEAALAERDEWKCLQRATAAILKQVETVRDVLKTELDKTQEIAKIQAERIGGYINVVQDCEAERDALAARLAPVDDKALVGLDKSGIRHYSDCAVNNEPAFPAGECDCGGYTLEKEAMRLTKENLELLDKNAHLTEERDALLARLAPVDDEALVEIVAVYCSPEMNWNEMSEKWKNSCRRDARAAINAVRPHIEAVERERCAKIAERKKKRKYYDPNSIGWEGEWEIVDEFTKDGKEIAAAIRSGK